MKRMVCNNCILVKNEEKYYEFIRKLRNDDNLINGFVNQTKITKEQQQQYMKVHKDEYFIALLNNEPVGFIGVVNRDLRLAVAKQHQKKGIATFMLQELMKITSDFNVQIKVDNIASLNFFKKNGFQEIDNRIIKDQKLIMMEKF